MKINNLKEEKVRLSMWLNPRSKIINGVCLFFVFSIVIFLNYFDPLSSCSLNKLEKNSGISTSIIPSFSLTNGIFLSVSATLPVHFGHQDLKSIESEILALQSGEEKIKKLCDRFNVSIKRLLVLRNVIIDIPQWNASLQQMNFQQGKAAYDAVKEYRIIVSLRIQGDKSVQDIRRRCDIATKIYSGMNYGNIKSVCDKVNDGFSVWIRLRKMLNFETPKIFKMIGKTYPMLLAVLSKNMKEFKEKVRISSVDIRNSAEAVKNDLYPLVEKCKNMLTLALECENIDTLGGRWDRIKVLENDIKPIIIEELAFIKHYSLTNKRNEALIKSIFEDYYLYMYIIGHTAMPTDLSSAHKSVISLIRSELSLLKNNFTESKDHLDVIQSDMMKNHELFRNYVSEFEKISFGLINQRDTIWSDYNSALIIAEKVLLETNTIEQADSKEGDIEKRYILEAFNKAEKMINNQQNNNDSIVISQQQSEYLSVSVGHEKIIDKVLSKENKIINNVLVTLQRLELTSGRLPNIPIKGKSVILDLRKKHKDHENIRSELTNSKERINFINRFLSTVTVINFISQNELLTYNDKLDNVDKTLNEDRNIINQLNKKIEDLNFEIKKKKVPTATLR